MLYLDDEIEMPSENGDAFGDHISEVRSCKVLQIILLGNIHV